MPLNSIAGFEFDTRVAAVFPDMIRRSVPGYASTLSMIGLLAQKVLTENCHAYDLGCSLGAATLSIREHTRAQNVSIIAVDNAPAMLEQCATLLGNTQTSPTVELRCEDIRTTPIENAALVVLNFTLQFVPIADRLPLLTKIRNGMNPQSALVLSEKITHDNPSTHDLFVELHHDFKRLHGYSTLEIAQKRSALENILIPESLDSHKQRLANAGFKRCEVWFQCLNFVSIIAFPE